MWTTGKEGPMFHVTQQACPHIQQLDGPKFGSTPHGTVSIFFHFQLCKEYVLCTNKWKKKKGKDFSGYVKSYGTAINPFFYV